MPALTVPSSCLSSKDASPPPSPTAPPYSPITPTMPASLPTNSANSTTTANPYPCAPPPIAHNKLASDTHNPAAFAQNATAPTSQQLDPRHERQGQRQQQPPPSQPISMSDNPDAIALRAAMSILQIQRQQALRDMTTLEEQKRKALSDPDGFARGVNEGRIRSRRVEGIVPAAGDRGDGETNSIDDDDDETAEHVGSEKADGAAFGAIPGAQNVVRMPPVNWSKYHIVGESLDKLHEEQRVRPSEGRVARDEDLRPGGRERGEESLVAGPYNPWVDRVGERMGRTRSGAKRKA